MIEIKLLLDDIDYSSIAELAMPLIKEKISENGGGFLGGLLGKQIPAFALNGLIGLLTPQQKDEIALKLINRNEDKIIGLLQKTASENGVNLTVKSLTASKADNRS